VIDSVENLAIVWASTGRLCSDLAAGQWDLPTGCPGWTVKDQLSHLADYEARALGRPAPRHEPGPLPHVKNEMGRANEVGVDARSGMAGVGRIVSRGVRAGAIWSARWRPVMPARMGRCCSAVAAGSDMRGTGSRTGAVLCFHGHPGSRLDARSAWQGAAAEGLDIFARSPRNARWVHRATGRSP